jgi:peptidoglycan/LPS O-acetylase OafA/YrhL
MKGRVKQLDALRAVAILLVLGCHVTWHPLLLRCGWTGVDLFFVLSGFLIAGLLFREYKANQTLHIRRFIARRGLKIYPAYYILLLATILYEARSGTLSWSRIWPDLCFVQNYKLGVWDHLWSLGTEEQFYLLLPCALALLTFRRATAPFVCVPGICLSIMAACLLSRTSYVLSGGPLAWFPGCIRGMDGLALGVMICYLAEFEPGTLESVCRKPGPLLVLSLTCLLPTVAFPFNHPFNQTAGLTLVYLGYAGLLLFSLKYVNPQGKVIGALAWIGSYSYTIYLFHMAVAESFVASMAAYVGRDTLFVLYLLLSIGLGVMVAKIVERPVLRIRETLIPSAPGTAAPWPCR